MQGIILKAISGFYYVGIEDNLIECKARGALKNEGILPLVGDIAQIEELSGTKGVLNGILPRKNFLSRPPVANIDRAFIISSYSTPSPNTLVIDKLISICEYKKITPVLVFNKSDMGDFGDIAAIYRSAGYEVIICSAKDNIGIEKIIELCSSGISVFTGNSGVGKSSIINRILPELELKTGEISEKLGRGRHTTRHSELYKLGGGYVVDTPGFSSLEIDKSDYGYKLNLADTFIEFGEFENGCKFVGCSHTGEKGCAVCEAVKSGKISPTRHISYKSIFDELKDLKPWNAAKK